MIDDKLAATLRNEGYVALCERGTVVCGIFPFSYTFGLVVGIDDVGYERRYCYEHWMEAMLALARWDGTGHPDGPWIKLKGRYQGEPVDMLNPALGFDDGNS